MNLYSFLGLIILSLFLQGIFLSIFLLFVKRERKLPFYFLSLFIFIFSESICFTLLLYLNYLTNFPFLKITPFALIFGLAPSLYFYIKSTLEPDFYFDKKYLAHFFPMGLELIYYLCSALNLFETNIANLHYVYVYPYEQLLSQLTITLYSFFGLRLIRKFEETWGSNEITRWLRKFIKFYLSALILWYVYILVDLIVFDNQLWIHWYYPLYVYTALVIYIIGYSSFIKPQIIFVKQNTKAKKIFPDEYSSYAKAIKLKMEKEKLYLNPELRIKSFSAKIQLPMNVVSEVVNQFFEMNFNDYVNAYRVKEVKKRFKNYDFELETIESIAQSCGFKSRSTFNLAFKKVEKVTPREFLMKIRYKNKSA